MVLERKFTYKYPTRKDSSKCIALENLTSEQKQYFGYHAKLLNNQYKSQ